MPAIKGITQYCDKCKGNIGTYAFRRHYDKCNGFPRVQKRTKILTGFERAIPIPATKCKFCINCLTTQSGLKNHERRCPNNPDRILEILTPEGRAKITAATKKNNTGRKIADTSKMGGYRKNAGRSKKFKVSDSFGVSVTLQSTYELRCAEILDFLNINWLRPKSLLYDNRKYYADFYLPDYDIYLDPKNSYKAVLDDSKIKAVIEQNNVRLFILLEHELTNERILELTSARTQ